MKRIMLSKRKIILYILIICTLLLVYNINLIGNKFHSIQYRSSSDITKIETFRESETKASKDTVINNDDAIDSKFLNIDNNNIKDNEANQKSEFKEDIDYINNYKGGEIEPEWEWIKDISIVYTWVDGSDIDFVDLKSKYNGGIRNVNSRDRSADELRYSLRSLQKYLPWHRGIIYIVTNQQIPSWLDTSNPRIKMIYHKDIFPEHIYPTYDSNTIELFFDKIPGITERFIYFNDDFFINNYIHPCYFFTSKTFYPKIYKGNKFVLSQQMVNKYIRQNDIHKIFQASKYFTRETIRKYFDPDFSFHNLYHSGYVFYRDLLEPYRRLFSKELRILCSDRFRNPYKIQSIYLYFAFLEYATKHDEFPLKLGGVGEAQNFEGYTLPKNRTIEKYSCEVIIIPNNKSYIKYAQITDISKNNNYYFNLFKTEPSILFYNFNDAYTKEKSLFQLTKYMVTRYPEVSIFEKTDYKELADSLYQNLYSIEGFIQDIKGEFPEENFSNKSKMIKFENIIEEAKLNKVKKFLDATKMLSGPSKTISSREKEELDILLSYHGEALDDQWNWAENISVVYILENLDDEGITAIMNRSNELKYSLRSIEKYLPWLKGKIFIVTQTEVQDELSWLNNSSERIELIRQDDIIPEISYQTQNKHIIEMYLDKIPGISERFIYLERNQYFIKYTHPLFFFNKDFYPKYNYDVSLSQAEIESMLNNENQSVFYSYGIIMKYFGKSYIKSYRFLKNAPYPFYRDLFSPARKLYEKYVNDTITHIYFDNTDFLPLYMVSTYNIYGTEQPYYPEFVPGYGEIKYSELPVLNENRTIKYYGFDITSPIIASTTMICNFFPFNTPVNTIDVNNIINEIINSNKIFLSFDFKNDEETILGYFTEFLDKLFNDKSSYEL